jgi:hypothetical protein
MCRLAGTRAGAGHCSFWTAQAPQRRFRGFAEDSCGSDQPSAREFSTMSWFKRTSISRVLHAPQSSQLPLLVQLAIPCCMVARSTRFPISGSSIRPSAFRRSDFSPRAAASCHNPCSTVARRERFLTLVSRIRPFACWPPSQPSYAFGPHHGLPISMLLGRTTHAVPDIGSSVRPSTLRQLSSPSDDLVPHHCSPFSMLLGCTSHAVPDIGSSLRPFAFR